MAIRAFVLRQRGEEIEGAVEDLDEAELGDDPVVIDVEWAALNFKDTMVTQPGNRVARTYPLVPGIDLAGTVVESGEPGIEPGTAVLAHGYDLGVAHHGGFATRARVPEGWVVPLPEGVSTRHAVAVGTAGFTAALSLRALERNGLRPGSGPVAARPARLRGGGFHRQGVRTCLLRRPRRDVGHRPRRRGRRRAPGSRSRALGRRNRLRRRSHPGCRAALDPLRRRGGRLRPDRRQQLHLDRLSVHRPRRGLAWDRFGPHPDRGPPGDLVVSSLRLPERCCRCDGRAGGGTRRCGRRLG